MGLPLLYARWTEECLGERIPEEKRATCGTCPLVLGRPFGSEDIRFDESTKCCTYLPELPTPLGIGMTPLYALIYKRAVGAPPGLYPVAYSESATETGGWTNTRVHQNWTWNLYEKP